MTRNNNNNQHINKILSVWKEHNTINEVDRYEGNFKVVEQIANFFSVGEFYYYIFNFQTLSMEFVSNSVEQVLGIKASEFTLEKLFSLYHPDDLERMHEKENAASEFLFNTLNPKDIPYYKIVYLTRFKSLNGQFKKILHQAKAIDVTPNGKIHKVLGVHTDVSHLNSPIDHKVSFIGEGRKSYFAVDPVKLEFETNEAKSLFTEQEVNVIKFISEGLNSNEIADRLCISVHTVKTHKRNILKKSGVKTSAHLVANCIRDGLI